jgi:hypothetical protein
MSLEMTAPHMPIRHNAAQRAAKRTFECAAFQRICVDETQPGECGSANVNSKPLVTAE